jgi:predicted permease
MNLRDWKLRLRALLRPGRVERELQDELAFHVECETRSLIEQGMTPDDARARAQARFGSSTVVADDCRDARGTAFVENAMRDIAYAIRSIRRAPLAALTIVATVSAGLAVVAVLFTFLNAFVFRVDQVPGVAEIYAVQRPPNGEGPRPHFTQTEFDTLRAETNVFSDVYAEWPDVDLRVDGRTMAVNLVSGNFFGVVRVPPAMGRVFTAADDAGSGESAGGNPVIVLSDKGWNRRFNRDPHVLGQTVLVNGVSFVVIGVMPPGFRGLMVGAPDFWAPLSQLAQFVQRQRGRDDNVGAIVGRLAPGISMENARAQLMAWDSNQPRPAAAGRDANIELLPHQGPVPRPLEAIAVFTPLFRAFGLILMIGCANVANLLLARGVARQREIGIRLSVGASRGRIVRQLMTESLLLALTAAAGGYVLSRLALVGALSWMMRVAHTYLGDINLTFPAADWRVAAFLLAAAIAATALFALLPALHATRIDPVRTLRGEVVKDARPGRARNALIGVQVFASALLLICAAIFLRSAIAASQFDPGFSTGDTVMIGLDNEPARAAMIQALAAEPLITKFAAVRPDMLDVRAATAVIGAGKIDVSYKSISGEYFDVMGVPLLRGRTFTTAERDDDPVAVVSESMARRLFPDGDAIGRAFRLEPDPAPPSEIPLTPRTVTIVGVSRDITGFRFTEVKSAVIFLPTSLSAPNTAVMARINGDPDLTRQTLLDHLTRIDPNLGMIVTMRTVARLEAFLLGVAFRIALALGLLALLLTVSGLFSVLSYLVAQRTREIGVRLALGASAPSVMRLMIAQTARPVLVGLLAGAGLAGALAVALRSMPAFLTEIVHVTDPVAYAASLILIAAACLAAAAIPARRAARLDPMQTLRQE